MSVDDFLRSVHYCISLERDMSCHCDTFFLFLTHG